MEMQTLVNEFKGRLERVSSQTQDAYKSYRDARKEAYKVLSSNVQTLAKAETDTVLSFYGSASERFNAARKESVKSVIFVPVDILPEGRERLVSAYREARGHFVKTREELSKILRKGFDGIRGSFVEAKAESKIVATKSANQAKAEAKKAETKAKQQAGTARKRASQGKTQAKKGASQAKTQAKKSASQARKSNTGAAKTQAKTQAKKGASQTATQAQKTSESIESGTDKPSTSS